MNGARKVRTGWVLLAFAALAIACSADERILKSGKESPTPGGIASPKSSVDQEIAAMRDADFRFIWILRRKDGGPMQAWDKAVIRVNTVDLNRRVLADEDRAVVIGTNALPPRRNIDALFDYFAVEDLSPVAMPQAAGNSNSKSKK